MSDAQSATNSPLKRGRAARPFKVEYEGMYHRRRTAHSTLGAAEAAVAEFLETDEARDPVAHLYDPEQGWQEYHRARR